MASIRRGGRQKTAVAAKDPTELVRVCARLAEDKKAEDIVVLNLRGLMYVTDFFVIASGGNPRQLHAIQSAIHWEMSQRGVRPIGQEGSGQDRWVLMDYGDFVVHLFDPDSRRLYDLELLWGDAPRFEWQTPSRKRSRAKMPKPPQAE
jgi:ribosome-associated protein